ncbi:predicted protein, partial [Nematostella vectensis]
DVCETLDELTLDFFEKYEELRQKRFELCSLMRDGYLSLSQARYSMGNKAVGPLQYSENMTALARVELGKNSFHLSKQRPGQKTEEQEATEASKNINDDGLRKRKVGNPEEKDNKEIKELESGIAELGITYTDPIKWFGVLVPSALRTGQNEFSTAVELCCDVANLENDLKRLVERFNELKHQKKAL